MNKCCYLVIAICIVIVVVRENGAQQRSPTRLDNDLDLQRTRIGDERVQRQVEVNRLERSIERLGARVKRLERLALGSSQFPAVTVLEAEAELRYAESVLQATEQAVGRGELSQTRLAADRQRMLTDQTIQIVASGVQKDTAVEVVLDGETVSETLLERVADKSALSSAVFHSPPSGQISFRLRDNHEVQTAPVEVIDSSAELDYLAIDDMHLRTLAETSGGAYCGIDQLRRLLLEITTRLQFMMDLGLNYLSLDRLSNSLSGGETQRINLTRTLGSNLTSSMYILDEPSVGLHSHDVAKLIQALGRLVDKGNTVVIIEHNLDIIKVADHIIDLGPEGGERGGEIVAEGTPEEIAQIETSFTGQYLRTILKDRL